MNGVWEIRNFLNDKIDFAHLQKELDGLFSQIELIRIPSIFAHLKKMSGENPVQYPLLLKELIDYFNKRTTPQPPKPQPHPVLKA